MSFVRKPRPYSSGLPEPFLAPPPTRPTPRAIHARGRSEHTGSPWATAVTALAVLGTAALLLVGGTGLVELLWKDAQFRSAAAGITEVQR